MKYCTECGHKLNLRYLKSEGREIPYCESCSAFRFPVFNTAVSMIVMNEKKDRILLIKQYQKDRNILVAGYVNQGEDAEDAVHREVMEEVGLLVISMQFNRSHYYAPSNTLMLNFTVTVKDGPVTPNEEVDAYQWFSIEEAKEQIYPGSLAQSFLNGYLDGTYQFK